MLIGASRLLLQDARRGKFYDDHFEIVEWGTRRNMSYNDVEQVSVEYLPIDKVFPALRLRKRIRLHMREQDEEILIPVDPSNVMLRTDLYSWLRGKIQLQ